MTHIMNFRRDGSHARELKADDPRSGAPPLLKIGRLHEIFGSAARAFAAALAGLRLAEEPRRPVIWIGRLRGGGALDPYGLASFLDPGAVVFVETRKPLDALWAMEEALRVDSAAAAICELDQPLDLTASRRLQLAAAQGRALALALTQELDAPRSNAAETRWRVEAAASGCEGFDAPIWRCELVKNKRGRTGAWRLPWGARGDWRYAAQGLKRDVASADASFEPLPSRLDPCAALGGAQRA